MEDIIKDIHVKMAVVSFVAVVQFAYIGWAALVERSREWAVLRREFKPCAPCTVKDSFICQIR